MDPKPQRIFKFYQDAGMKWRWRCTTVKGRSVAVSGESFFNKATAIRAARQEAAYYGDAATVQEEARKRKPQGAQS
jgi:hypothetical protein